MQEYKKSLQADKKNGPAKLPPRPAPLSNAAEVLKRRALQESESQQTNLKIANKKEERRQRLSSKAVST